MRERNEAIWIDLVKLNLACDNQNNQKLSLSKIYQLLVVLNISKAINAHAFVSSAMGEILLHKHFMNIVR